MVSVGRFRLFALWITAACLALAVLCARAEGPPLANKPSSISQTPSSGDSGQNTAPAKRALGVDSQQSSTATPSSHSQSSIPVPKIEVVSPRYNFGSVLEGTLIRHAFTLRNAGQADLVIKAVHAACGCTAGKPARQILKPGESTDLDVTFDTHFEKGYRSRTVTVYTNDPVNPAVDLILEGQIRVELEARPSELNFGTVRRGQELTRDVEVVFTGEGPFEIRGVSNSNSNIEAQVISSAKASKANSRLRITLRKTMPVGPFYDTVQVVTSRETLVVPVFGRVIGDLIADPPQVSFGVVGRGHPTERILRLTNAGQKPIKIIAISSSNPSVTAKAEETKPGKEYKIVVELLKDAPEGQVRGALRVVTDSPTETSLTIPFYAIVGGLRS